MMKTESAKKISYTKDQQAVIDTPIKNLLVSAAAGSGKTAVLVERIMNRLMIDENASIDRLLIVTFTKNAAAALREKIGKQLNKRINDLSLPEEIRKRFYAQKMKLPYADIMTIDGFSGKLLKNFFYAIDIDPNYRVGDTTELQLLLEDVIDETLLSEYSREDNASFVEFMMAYGDSKGDEMITKKIKDVLDKEDSMADSDQFYENIRSNYEILSDEDFYNSKLGAYIAEKFDRAYENACDKLNKGLEIAEDNEVFKKYENSFRNCLALTVTEKNWADMTTGEKNKILKGINAFFNNDKPSASTKDYPELTELCNKIKEYRGSVKDEIAEVSGLLPSDLSEFYDLNKKCLVYIDEFIRICRLVRSRYQEEKMKRNIMSFADISHYALKIADLCTDEIRSMYDEIMIDEYQDSNDIQEVLLSKISGQEKGRNNMFMVGDVKQSIYGFRMAKPSLFIGKYDCYSLDKDADEQKINLQMNFRSTIPVVDTVNMLFEKLMTKEHSGIAYDKDARLEYGELYDDYPELNLDKSEFILINSAEKSKKADNTSLVIRALAKKVDELKQNFTVFEDGEKRKLSYGDICILGSSVKNFSAELSNYFMDRNVAVELKAKDGFFKTREIVHMLAFLKILDNPYQDIELATVLRSYFGGVTDDEFVMLKLFERSKKNSDEDRKIKRFLFSVIKDYSTEGEDSVLSEKLSKFIELYNELKLSSAFLNIRDEISLIYKKTAYYDYVRILPAGRQRIANLDMLLIKASDFEKTGKLGISHFMSYIEKIERNQIDDGEASPADDTDSIKVMTIHGSKGLEFPVVIVLETETEFIKDTSDSKLRIHHEAGIGMKYFDSEAGSYNRMPQCSMVDHYKSHNEKAERIRLLYVAMTRAKQKLIMYSVEPKKPENKPQTVDEWLAKKHDGVFTNDEIDKMNSFDAMLGPVFAGVNNEFFEFSEIDAATLEEDGVEKEDKLTIPDEKELNEIRNYLNDFEYQFPESNLPVKYSVSELKHAAIEEYEAQLAENKLCKTDPDPEPESAETEGVEPKSSEPKKDKKKKENIGAKRGTLYHELMEKLVLTDITDSKDVKEFIAKEASEGRIDEDAVKLVKAGKIAKFLKSDICKRMREAEKRGELFLEQPFVYGLPAEEINADYHGDERVLLQGVVDVFFIENDQITVLDYKTDRVTKDEKGAEKLKGYYDKQLTCYAAALSSILKKSVKEKILYSFSLENTVYL